MELELDLYIGKDGDYCAYLGSDCGSGIEVWDKTAEGAVDKLKPYLLDYFEGIKNGDYDDEDEDDE